jgi:hypothetical protein
MFEPSIAGVAAAGLVLLPLGAGVAGAGGLVLPALGLEPLAGALDCAAGADGD